MARVGVALVALALLTAATVQAQELEPRAYTNTPVGMNFLVLGYATFMSRKHKYADLV